MSHILLDPPLNKKMPFFFLLLHLKFTWGTQTKKCQPFKDSKLSWRRRYTQRNGAYINDTVVLCYIPKNTEQHEKPVLYPRTHLPHVSTPLTRLLNQEWSSETTTSESCSLTPNLMHTNRSPIPILPSRQQLCGAGMKPQSDQTTSPNHANRQFFATCTLPSY